MQRQVFALTVASIVLVRRPSEISLPVDEVYSRIFSTSLHVQQHTYAYTLTRMAHAPARRVQTHTAAARTCTYTHVPHAHTPTCMHTHTHMHMHMHTQTHAYAPTRMHPTSVRVSDMHVLMPYQTCGCMLTHTLQIQSANPKRTDEHQPARDDFATCRAIKKRPCDMTRQQQDVTVCDMTRQQQQNWRHVASSRRRADTCAIQFILLGCDRDIFSYLCCSL